MTPATAIETPLAFLGEKHMLSSIIQDEGNKP